ncbi:hypothetical protein DFJ74DRAFT_718514, partial [Hyaloraphidium curvatum]
EPRCGRRHSVRALGLAPYPHGRPRLAGPGRAGRFRALLQRLLPGMLLRVCLPGRLRRPGCVRLRANPAPSLPPIQRRLQGLRRRRALLGPVLAADDRLRSRRLQGQVQARHQLQARRVLSTHDVRDLHDLFGDRGCRRGAGCGFGYPELPHPGNLPELKRARPVPRSIQSEQVVGK